MQRFVIFLVILAVFVGVYNFRIIESSLFGFFGDASYRKEDLANAKKHYEDTLKNLQSPLSSLGEGLGVRDRSALLSADILYNLGNTLYRLGEKEKGEKRWKLWDESIGSYTKSLSIRTDSETEENLVFVRKKLEEEKKEQEQKQEEASPKKKEETKNDSGTPENKEKGDETGTGSDDTKNKSSSWQSWSNQGSYNPVGWQDTDKNNSSLSPADRQEVKKYIDELKQFEKQNGKLLNPERWPEGGSLSEEIRNFFGNDSFFQDILRNNDGKKDW